MSGNLGKSRESKDDVDWIYQFLSGNERLKYIFDCAQYDLAQNSNQRMYKITDNYSGVILRSCFDDTNIFYTFGTVSASEAGWILEFPQKGEIHIEPAHEQTLKSMDSFARLQEFKNVRYYVLKNPRPFPRLDGPSSTKIDYEDFLQLNDRYNVDPIHYREMFKLPQLGIVQDGFLVACGGVIYLNPISKTCQIGNFLTHPAYRSRGFARIIATDIINLLSAQEIKSIRLEVYDDNVFARKLYESLGFQLECISPMGTLIPTKPQTNIKI